MSNIKDMVKDKTVSFLFYKEGELWYTTECGFNFPVPTDDTGTAAMNAEDKAILFMRWIRKELEAQNKLAAQLEDSKLEVNTTRDNIFDDKLR